MQGKQNFSRSFARNILLLLFVNFLVKPAYIFLIDAQVQNRVGENEYGLFFSIFNYCMLFQVVLDPGILNYNSQLIAKNPEKASFHFAGIAGAKLILVLLYVALVFLFSWPIGFSSEHLVLLPGIVGILVLMSFSQYLRSHFAALGKYSYEAWYSGLDKFLMIFIIGYMLYVEQQISIQIFIAGQIAALALSCLLFLFLLRKSIHLKLRFSFREIKEVVTKATPYALVLLFMTLFTRLDGIMLERLLDDNAYSAGVYARGYRMLDAANMLGILFAGLMLPMFAKLIKDKAQLNKLVEDITRLLFYITLLVSLCSWFYSKELMDLIYTQNTAEHYTVFRYLMTGYLAMSMANIFGCLFLASENLRKINQLFFSGILINFSLNLLLIPTHGAAGAAITTIITQYIVFAGQLYLAVRHFKLHYSAQTYSGIAILSVFGGIVFKMGAVNVSLNWFAEIVVLVIFMMILAFLCGFLRFSVFLKR